jgi:salicylate hydroxylase
MSIGPRDAALIAGGGIGGLAAALALARIGWPSVVAERRCEWSEAGAGIQLSPNGVRVLEQLGVAARLEPFAARPREIVVRDAATARVLQRLPLGDWIEARHGAPYWQVHRRDLQAALVAAIEAEPLIAVTMGFEAVSFEARGERVALRAKDGRQLEGALLVGADGVFSAVRQQLFATPEPRFSGRTATRTVVAAARPADNEPLLRPDATGIWLAPGAHIVHYPVRKGREVAIVIVRTARWGGHGWSEPAEAAELETALAGIAPRFAQALGTGHAWRRWALFETEPLSQWSQGRVTLLGDAAHPTLPFLAQGGVLALEDASTLGACLSRVGAPAEVPAALAAYETQRATRSRHVVAAARRNGLIFHLSGLAALARNAAMHLMPGERIMAAYDWVYAWRPDED